MQLSSALSPGGSATLWVPASEMVATVGAPSMVVHSTSLFPAWALDADSNESVAAGLHVPSGPSAIGVVYAAEFADDSNTVQIRVDQSGGFGQADVFITLAGPTQIDHFTGSIPTTTSGAFKVDVTAAGTETGAQTFTVNRLATDILDTWTHDLLILGLWVAL